MLMDRHLGHNRTFALRMKAFSLSFSLRNHPPWTSAICMAHPGVVSNRVASVVNLTPIDVFGLRPTLNFSVEVGDCLLVALKNLL